jgi:feruloyl esterase
MLTRTMGGLAPTQAFARLFLLPGMGHCRTGGVNFADLLGALDAWVEGGKAPEQITAYAIADPDVGPTVAPAGFTGNNIEIGQPKLSRPLFPYPDQARYQSGDANAAASFQRVRGSGSVK